MFKHCPFTRWDEYNHVVVIQPPDSRTPFIEINMIEDWLQENNIFDYTRRLSSFDSNKMKYWFKNGNDAMYFALKWAGK